MRKKLLIGAGLAAVGCICWLGCRPIAFEREPTLAEKWGVAVSNTARAYFRLGVAAGDKANLVRRVSGKPEVSGEVLFKEAIEMFRDDPYLKAP